MRLGQCRCGLHEHGPGDVRRDELARKVVRRKVAIYRRQRLREPTVVPALQGPEVLVCVNAHRRFAAPALVRRATLLASGQPTTTAAAAAATSGRSRLPRSRGARPARRPPPPDGQAETVRRPPRAIPRAPRTPAPAYRLSAELPAAPLRSCSGPRCGRAPRARPS